MTRLDCGIVCCGHKVATHFPRDGALLRLVSSQVFHRDGLFPFFSPFALSLKTSRGWRPPSPSCGRPCRHWAFRRVSSEPFGGYWQPSTTWVPQGPAKVGRSCTAHLGCQLSALAGAWQSPSLNEAGQGQCRRLCV